MIKRVRDFARASLESINQLMGNVLSGYNAANISRLNNIFQNLNENAVPHADLLNLESNAKQLWRNSPAARKIVSQIKTKTIGTGMRPIPQATRPDGKPHVEFRRRAKEIWAKWVKQSDARGLPGRGGDHFADQSKTALATVVRSGNVLYQVKRLTRAEQRRRGLMLPVVVQLIDADRLDNAIQLHEGSEVHRGIEVDASGMVVAYHLLDRHPADAIHTVSTTHSTRVPARDIGHVFTSDDIDQYFGVSWFAPILTSSRDIDDYTYNELKAAVLSSCIVMGVKGMAGATGVGVRKTNADTVDSSGNALSRMVPGMIIPLGQNGSLEGFDPKRPNTNATEFSQHLLRQLAVGVPGIKGSSLTGDFRNSSFSSEKSADNETWPEIEAIQQWWSCSFQQHIYEEVIIAAINEGLFDDILLPGEFAANRTDLLNCNWQGPVAKSINPKDDQAASRMAMKNLTSSVQVEAGKFGRDSLELMQDLADYIEQVNAMGIDDEYKRALIYNAMGMDNVPSGTASVDTEDADADADGEALAEVDADDDKSDEIGTNSSPNRLLEHV